MTITQDDRQIAVSTLTGRLAERLRSIRGLNDVKWGDGIYGPFGGAAIAGTVTSRPRSVEGVNRDR